MMIQTAKDIELLDFEKGNGLIPVIIQDKDVKDVRMLGYANKASLLETLSSGKMTFFSRSRRKLWTKGESSGKSNRLWPIAIAILYLSQQCQKDPPAIQEIALVFMASKLSSIFFQSSNKLSKAENLRKHRVLTPHPCSKRELKPLPKKLEKKLLRR